MASFNEVFDSINKMDNPQLNLTIQRLSETKDSQAQMFIDYCKKRPGYKRLEEVSINGVVVKITHN